ncbi:class I SAM-dependent methyltransferase [Desulfonatronum thioautotrophicum]|uniref:class I SAM-dependent methyltransferase n=1 Tax=Desulfonatronum thioautotrophicum TaxID=617001 RepID=UPI0005EBD823|nr:class I SAM-dependent methyltransferase [Desulfonatronum thioautotrophicum]
MPLNALRKLSFLAKNHPLIRPVIERNRWLVAAYFDWRYRKQDTYNYATSEEERIKRDRIAAFLNDRHYANILEVGCGEGYMTTVMAPLGDRLLGIDISKIAVERAKRMHAENPRISFQQADVFTFQPPDAYDLITCSEILCYLNLEQINLAVRNLVAHLTPGGRLLAVDVFASGEAEAGLELKKIGARTIHPLLESIPELTSTNVQTHPGYEMMLFEKTDPSRLDT